MHHHPPSVTIKNVSRHCQMSLGGWRGWGQGPAKSLLVEKHCSRNKSFTKAQYFLYKVYTNTEGIHCFILFLFFNWSRVDLQCCDDLCYTARWLSYTHVDILFLYSFPSWFITGYWVLFPVLYIRTVLFIYSKCNSLHLPTPNSQSIPLPPSSPLATASLFSMSMSLFLFHR